MADTIHKRLFGRIAVKLKFVTEPQLEECLKLQKDLSQTRKDPVLLGQIMRSQGYLTESQLETILNVQNKLKTEREQCALAQMGIGDTLVQLGDVDEAVRQYAVVLEKYPDVFEVCATTKNKMAELYRKSGQPKKAMDTLRRLLKAHEQP